MLAAFAGAWLVTLVSAEFLRRLLPAVLLVVLIYTLMRKDMGRHHAPRFHGKAELLATSTIGLTIGFYDGFLVQARVASLCFCWSVGWAMTF